MKKLLKFIGFVIITLIITGLLSGFLCTSERKDTLHIRGFFREPKNTIDVIAVGASEVYTSFNSPLLWEKYGFTSYAISFAGAPGSLYPEMLAQALKYQTPKLVLIEVNGFLHGDKYLDDTSKLHTWYDNVPFSKKKILQMKATIPKDKIGEFLVPMLKYHDNWRHPRICFDSIVGKIKLRNHGISYTKNFGTTAKKRDTSAFEKFEPKFSAKSREYMIELLDFCKDNGLKNVMFYRNPHCLTDIKPEVIDEVCNLVESYGYKFKNLDDNFEELNLDSKHDFYNTDHVNVYGMEKISNYLGQYIIDNYDVKSEHSQDDIDRWNNCNEKMQAIISSAKQDIDNNKYREYYEMSAF